MTIAQVHSLFKERWNRLASDYHQDLSNYQIDRFLNDGMFQLLQRITRNETSSKFTNLVNALVHPQSAIVPVRAGNTYTVNLDTLDFPFYEIKRVIARTNCGPVQVVMETHGRIQDLLGDAMRRPSQQWRRLLGVVEGSGTDRILRVYSEDGFVLNTLTIYYVRYPRDVFYGGYDTPDYLFCVSTGGTDCDRFDNSGTSPRTFDLPDVYHTLAIDFAVEETLRSLELAQGYTLRAAKTVEHSS